MRGDPDRFLVAIAAFYAALMRFVHGAYLLAGVKRNDRSAMDNPSTMSDPQ
jgi:hypothetical protein